MRKVAVDFKNLTPEIIDEIIKVYPQGFAETDMISFTSVDGEIENCIKVIVDDTLFMIKKEVLKKVLIADDRFDDKFDEEYFSSLPKGDESCDAEYC